jgi:Domain of unknown function (DUF4440)
LRFLRSVSIACLALGFLPSLHPQQLSQAKSLTADQNRVVDVLTSVFAAAEADDTAKFDSLLAPGFYMFDNGKRFDGDAIMALIKSAHAAGMKYEWNVTSPDVHITGKTAWIAYVNHGSITDAKGAAQSITWLESADLVKQHGVWKLVFLESERAAPQP